MDNIKNYNPAEAETLDSREVAEMVEKQHRHLLRDARGHRFEFCRLHQNKTL